MKPAAYLGFMLFLVPLLFSCSSNAAQWTAHRFDGRSFQPDQKKTAETLWLKSGYLPHLGETVPDAVGSQKLAKGAGAVAGLCFLQTSGGKLANANSSTPYPDEQITMKLPGEGVYVTRTDAAGYFIDSLYPGEYEFQCRGFKVTGTVRAGETTLIPIRGGKRMAD